MAYVDGFLLPVRRDGVDEYRKICRLARKLWLEHGALQYHECIEDDVPDGKVTSFRRAVKLKEDEVVFFSFIVFRSRRDRDRINAKVMADPRMKVFEGRTMPFDMKRMMFGGFKSFVSG